MAVDDFSIGTLMFVDCEVWKVLIGGVMKEELICKVYIWTSGKRFDDESEEDNPQESLSRLEL